MLGTAVIVPAAGLGVRLGGDGPKAFREIRGEALLVHAVRGVRAARIDLSCVVIAVPPGAEAIVAQDLQPYAGDVQLTVVPGGAERTDSVRAALELVPVEGVDCVLVHDAARAFVPAEVIERVVTAIRGGAQAVIPVMPVTDTIKRVGPGGEVLDTPERSALVAVQTPQGFEPEVLRRAHAQAGSELATDDAMLCERLGVKVQTVQGSEDAFKVTRPRDLLLAEWVLAGREQR